MGRKSLSCAKQAGAMGTQHGVSIAHMARDAAADFVIVPLQSLTDLQKKKKKKKNGGETVGIS